MKTVTLEDLREARCEVCQGASCDDPIVLSQRCHPEAGVRVSFIKATSSLEIVCKRCKRPVVNVRLAPDAKPDPSAERP